MSEGLNIIVCIKQVPETTEVDFDEETGRLKREGVAAVINPFDEYAIEEGLKIKEAHGGTVKVLTMGPPWAADALRDAIAMGADEGYLATDRAFAGADTWATSLTLAKTIEHMGDYDIIITGSRPLTVILVRQVQRWLSTWEYPMSAMSTRYQRSRMARLHSSV